MKKILLFLFFLPLISFSQNYEYVKTNGTYLFGDDFAYRIDSISTADSGQLLYSYRRVYTIINDYEGYLDPYTSWLGDQVLVDEEGRTNFYSWTNHPFVFYSDYEVGVEWKVFEYENGNYMNGRFINDAEWIQIFPNLEDSVKTIGLQMYNSNGEPIDHNYNGFQIRLSRNHGMLDAIYFVAIDQFEPYTSELLSLTGIKTENSIYGEDFYYKDALSSLEINSKMHFISYFSSEDHDPHLVVRTVVGKQLSDNYCTYTYLDSILYQGVITTNTHSGKWYISALPFESMFPNDSLNKTGYMFTGGANIGEKWNHNTYFYYHFWHAGNTTIFGQDAWFVNYWELNMGNQYDYLFIKNVGNLTVGKGNDWPGDELVYYKNSNDEWGDPLIIAPYEWNGDYKVLNPEYTYYFKKSPIWGPVRNMRAIRIDSIVPTTDSLKSKYYSYRTPEEYLYNDEKYLNPNTSWIGDYALVNDSGTTTFYNQKNDEIVFNSGTEWGLNQWTMYEYENGDYILASLESEALMEVVPGITDTGRYIYFQARYADGTYMNHTINSATLRWSKNCGLLDYFDFNIFPEISVYHIIGIDSSGVSTGWKYNFDDVVSGLSIGDETHSRYQDSLFQTHQIRRKVIGKAIDENSVKYIIDICENIETPDSTYLLNYIDTNIYILNALPRESILNSDYTGHQQSTGFGYFDSVDICGNKEYYEFNTIYKTGEILIDGKIYWETNTPASLQDEPNLRFIHNIGTSTHLDWGETEGDTIIYFVNESESCGTAFEFNCASGTSELSDSQVQISPNPSDGIFNIQSSKKIAGIKVYDLNGRIVWQANELKKTQIDLSTLSDGLYILRIHLNGNQIINEKIVLQK